MHSTVATTIGSTPGTLAFSRDMFLNSPLAAEKGKRLGNVENIISMKISVGQMRGGVVTTTAKVNKF